MRAWVAEAKKEAGPDEFLRNSSDSASYFLCSFSLGHLDGSGWDENKSVIQTPDRQYGVLTHIDDFKGFLTS